MLKKNSCYSIIILAIILGFVMIGYGHGISGDRDNLAVGPDGLIYVIMHGGMMGPGMEPGSPGVGQARLLAVDPAGMIPWSFDIEGFEAVSVPVIATDGTVYFSATEFGFDDHGPGVNPGDDVMSRGRLFAVKNGQLKWTYDFDGMMASRPVLAPDGTIYFTTSFFDESGGMGPGFDGPMQATLYALRDAQTVAFLDWNLEFDSPMASQPVLRTGIAGFPWVLYVSVSDMGHDHGPHQGGPRDEIEILEIHPDGSFRRIL